MPPKGNKNTLMFSATFPGSVRELSAGKPQRFQLTLPCPDWCKICFSEYLLNPVELQIGMVGAASNDVQQTIYEVCF